MKRTPRAAGVAACLGLMLILAGSALPRGSAAELAAPGSDAAPPQAEPSAVAATRAAGSTSDRHAPAGSLSASDAIAELRARGRSNAPALVVDASGVIRTVTAAPGTTLGRSRDAFATRYAAGFGARENTKLARTTTTTLPGGDKVTRYQQTVGGVPVMGGELTVTTTADGQVRSAISALSGYSPKTVAASVSAAQARSIATTAIGQKYAVDASVITGVSAKLWLYDAARIGAPGTTGLRPTYWVRFAGANGLELGDVLVDARDGTVRLVAQEQQSARNRRICDLADKRVDLRYLSSYDCSKLTAARVEGGALSAVADVNKAYDHLGTTYDFYQSTFGLDSFDGKGAQIRATVRACHSVGACPYNNAFWDGTQFVFGAGWVTDDVVAHEFTHAVTEYSSTLYYWYEPGAINEAFSDIMGQFVDLRTPGDDTGTDVHGWDKRWLLGEDVVGNDFTGPIRYMKDPTVFQNPASYWGAYWDTDPDLYDNGGVHTNSGVANKLAQLIADGGTLNGYTNTGIGLTKSEQLWYRVMHLLSSGADYRELRLAMASACREFIGHQGFTVDDCTQVGIAMNAVQLPLSVATERTASDAFCPGSAYEPPTDLFVDDFEHGGGNWTLSSRYYWLVLPTAGAEYSYAASGKRSLNGWTASSTGGSGHLSTATLNQGVALPVGKSAYLHFATSLIQDYPGYGAASVQVSVDGGGWAQIGIVGTATAGYTARRYDLSAYAGHTVRVRFQLQDASNYFMDWYADDVRIYNCVGRPSAPTDPVAYLDGTTIHVSWDDPLYAGTGGAQPWNVSVSPPPDPNFMIRSSSGGRELLDITNVDPLKKYEITIAYGNGAPVTLAVTPWDPASCPAAMEVSPFILSGTRPLPTRSDGCTPPVIIPRR